MPPLERGDWQPGRPDHEDVRFTSADGTKLHGWFVPASQRQAGHPLLPWQRRTRRLTTPIWWPMLRDELDGVGLHLRLPRLRPQRRLAHRSRAALPTPSPPSAGWPERMGIQPERSRADGPFAGRRRGVSRWQPSKAPRRSYSKTPSRRSPTWPPSLPLAAGALVMKNRYDSLARIQKYQRATLSIARHGRYPDPARSWPATVRRLPSANKQFMELPGLGHDDLASELLALLS